MLYKPLILLVCSTFLTCSAPAKEKLHDSANLQFASRDGDGPTYDKVLREMDARKWAIREQRLKEQKQERIEKKEGKEKINQEEDRSLAR